MVAAYNADGDSFRIVKPSVWSDAPFARRPRQRSFDLHPAGDRFALAVPDIDSPAAQDHVVLVLNFFDELGRLVPPPERCWKSDLRTPLQSRRHKSAAARIAP